MDAKTGAALYESIDLGLRLSERRHIRIDDIDSNRMTMRVRLGNGQKDSYACLTAELLRAKFSPQLFNPLGLSTIDEPVMAAYSNRNLVREPQVRLGRNNTWTAEESDSQFARRASACWD